MLSLLPSLRKFSHGDLVQVRPVKTTEPKTAPLVKMETHPSTTGVFTDGKEHHFRRLEKEQYRRRTQRISELLAR